MRPVIDTYAYRSRLAAVRVQDKLLFCAPPLLFCLFTGNPLAHLLVILLMVPATLFFSSTPCKTYGKLLLIPAGFLLLSVLTVLITAIPTGEVPLFSISLFGAPLGVTSASLHAGLLLFSRAFAAVCCLYFLSLTTPMNSLLAFLRRIHVPALLVDLMELIYRFIFTLWGEASRIRLAQETRLGYKGLKRSFSCMAQLVSGVLVSAVTRADRIRLCLESRGFNGSFDSLAEPESGAPCLPFFGIGFTLLLIFLPNSF